MQNTRILDPSELEATWATLTRAWNITDTAFWFPLVSTERDAVVAFEAPDFLASLGVEGLRAILAARGVERVLHFPEYTELPGQEISLADAEFRYTTAEGYWCDARFEQRDWIVYASHENSVTLGGAWLLAEVQRAWPAWADHLWNYEADSYRPPAT